MSDPRELRRLQDELRATAKELTDQVTRKWVRDDNTITTHTAPALLTQLRDAIASGSTERRNGRGRGTPLPIDVDAADTLEQIGIDAARLHYEALNAAALTAEDRIRALVAIVGRWTNTDAVASALTYVQRWRAEIQHLLDPPRAMHIAAPCPECGTRMVRRYDDRLGEDLLIHALQVDPALGCRCLACGGTWPPERFEHLARVLDCDPLPNGDTAA